MRIYLDTNALIYSIEGSAYLKNAVKSRTANLDRLRGDEVITSRLSLLECRVKPIRDGLSNLLAAYDLMFASGYLRICEISPTVIDRATSVRAKYGVKTPDSIHLATAIDEHADEFLTADRALSRCTEIVVVQI